MLRLFCDAEPPEGGEPEEALASASTTVSRASNGLRVANPWPTLTDWPLALVLVGVRDLWMSEKVRKRAKTGGTDLVGRHFSFFAVEEDLS